MTNEYLMSVENKIHGWRTRLKELHFSAPSYSLHKIIDDFVEELDEWDDSIMEDGQAIFGFIEPGDIQPVLPRATNILDLLGEIRATLADMKETLTETMYTGIINENDDFWHTVNKTIYLSKIAQKGQ